MRADSSIQRPRMQIENIIVIGLAHMRGLDEQSERGPSCSLSLVLESLVDRPDGVDDDLLPWQVVIDVRCTLDRRRGR